MLDLWCTFVEQEIRVLAFFQGASVWEQSFLGFGFGFSSFRVSASVYSFQGFGLLILRFRSGFYSFEGFGVALLLLGFRGPLTPFRDLAFLFRVSVCVYSFYFPFASLARSTS